MGGHRANAAGALGWHGTCIFPGTMPTACRLPYILFAGLLAACAGRAAADVYIYELPGGTRMITDHVLNNKQYKLIRASRHIKGMGALMQSRNSVAMLADVNAYDELIYSVAAAHRVDPALIKAVVHAESAFNPHATSHKGALGLMQLMPATARQYGVDDAFDPRQNIRGGAAYLRDLLARFNNNHKLALAAYNAGEQAVIRYQGVPPYNETQGYVRKVLKFKARYAKRVPPRSVQARL